MILDYRDDEFIQVRPSRQADTARPVTIEVRTVPAEAGGGWALVLAFRTTDPLGVRSFPFRVVSLRGLELLLSELQMALRDSVTSIEKSQDPAEAMPWTSSRLFEGFEPYHNIEAECSGGRVLEIVFSARRPPAEVGSLRISRALGVPLLFPTPSEVPRFVAEMQTAVERLLRDVRAGQIPSRGETCGRAALA